MERSTLVRAGDKIENLTAYFGVPENTLMAANPQVVPGEQLLTPGTFISLPATTRASESKKVSLHAYIAGLAGGSEPAWLQTARRELGVHELPGSPSNPRIVEYMHSVTTLKAPANNTDETAWCACFMQWVLAQVGIAGTNNAWALSYKNWASPSPRTARALAASQYSLAQAAAMSASTLAKRGPVGSTFWAGTKEMQSGKSRIPQTQVATFFKGTAGRRANRVSFRCVQ